jgi:hypothetical protein
VRFRGSADHQSAFRFGSLSNLEELTAVDARVEERPLPALVAVGSRSADASVSIAQQVSDRSDLSARYSAKRTIYDDVDIEGKGQKAGAQFRRRLSGALAMNLGYEFNEWGATPKYDRNRIHTFSGGLNIATGLTTRTGFSASAGTAVIPGKDGSNRLGVIGGAAIRHRFSPAWTGGAEYSRNISFIEGLADPLTFDGVRVRLTGALTERLSASVSAAYLLGHGLAQANPRQYRDTQGNAVLQYRLGRDVMTFIRYDVYRYDLTDSLIELGVPGLVHRQSVLAGVTLFVGSRLQ